MRTLLTLLASFIAAPSFCNAQIQPSPQYGVAQVNEIARINEAHDRSQAVQQKKQEIETQYNVKCVGESHSVFPWVYNRITYRATCSNEKTSFRLKIRSKYYVSREGYQFRYLKDHID